MAGVQLLLVGRSNIAQFCVVNLGGYVQNEKNVSIYIMKTLRLFPRMVQIHP